MTTACTLCPRDAADGSRICPRHADELRGWLAEIPAQARLLEEEFVAPGGGPAQGRLGGTGRAHAPAPVDLRVLTLLGPGHADPTSLDDDGTIPIAVLLGAWAGHIAYHYPAATRDRHGTARIQPCAQARPRHGESITGWCAWHRAYLPFTLTLAAAADYHRALDHLVHRLRALTHTSPRITPRAAPCPDCEAFALITVDGRWGITCDACGHHLEPNAYDAHAAHILQTVAAG
ncbi:hypothetical protein ACFYQA_17380 [Streptomyces sp. NPDC005774]|uniref:hypothetical protein n=1 Tax=Streptomyces sp. NPDC005774 TaxID=3364728 RepID=UPI0036CF11EF